MMFYEGWILTLGLALLFLAFLRMFAWRRVRQSTSLRVIACLFLSCCLAPSFCIFGGIIIWPASLMAAWALVDDQNRSLVVSSVVSLCVTFALMFGLWSRALKRAAAGHDER
jgi:hypothetical protein